MTIEEQFLQVQRVKRYESGMITEPITVSPEQSVRETVDLMQEYQISGVPVTDGKIIGIFLAINLRFETNFEQKVRNVMTKGRERLITVSQGISLEDARNFFIVIVSKNC